MLPNKVVAFGRNYREHAQELGNAVPEAPFAFFKPLHLGDRPPATTSSTRPSPRNCTTRPSWPSSSAACAARSPRERVKDVVFGYTCANDITARDVQRREKQWARAKGFDSACPLGPWVETDLSVDAANDLTISSRSTANSASWAARAR